MCEIHKQPEINSIDIAPTPDRLFDEIFFLVYVKTGIEQTSINRYFMLFCTKNARDFL